MQLIDMDPTPTRPGQNRRVDWFLPCVAMAGIIALVIMGRCV